MSKFLEKITNNQWEGITLSLVATLVNGFGFFLLRGDLGKDLSVYQTALLIFLMFVFSLILLYIVHSMFEYARKMQILRRRFCGFWINFRPETPNIYGIYEVFYEDKQIKVDGRVYNAIKKNYESEWQSIHVVEKDLPHNVNYLYIGKSTDNLQKTKQIRSYGICYLEFDRITGDFEDGSGYFIDDRDADDGGTNRPWKQQTKFKKINSDFCLTLGLKESRKYTIKGKLGWHNRKELADKYHEYLNRQTDNYYEN